MDKWSDIRPDDVQTDKTDDRQTDRQSNRGKTVYQQNRRQTEREKGVIEMS